jgi:alpha-beta hydrolase superfamily lysophospholipase
MKLTLSNRKSQIIVGVLESPTGPVRGTAIIQHGYSGYKEEAHIVMFGEVFRAHGFQTFTFDATNSFGESDGKFEDARLGLHYEDLEDVVRWAQVQSWFTRPLALIGHSMGGYAVARYTEDHPADVDLLCPIAPVVSGALRMEAYNKFEPGKLEKWKVDGIFTSVSANRGVVKNSPYAVIEEYMHHDLLGSAQSVTVPTLLVTGSLDTSCPPEHVGKLFEAIASVDKEFKVLDGEQHNYSEKGLEHLRDELHSWLKNRI